MQSYTTTKSMITKLYIIILEKLHRVYKDK